MGVRIAHISDAHLGRRQYHLEERERDYAEAFKRALEAARSADAVLVTGDLFDYRRPSPQTISELIDAVRSVGLPVVAIGGNHDFNWLRPGDTHLEPLAKLGLIRLLHGACVDLGGVTVIGVGAVTREGAVLVRRAVEKCSPRGTSVLAIHQAVEGVEAGYPVQADTYTVKPDLLRGLPVTHVAAGHIHDFALRHPELPIAWAGSLEIWDDKEFETWVLDGGLRLVRPMARKGFLFLEAGEGSVSVKPVELGHRRRMVRVEAAMELDRASLIRFVEDVARQLDYPGSIIHVRVVGVARGDVPSLGELRQMFRRALSVRVEVRAVSSQRVARMGRVSDALMRLLRDELGDEGLALRVVEALRLVSEDRDGAVRMLEHD